MPKDGKKIAIGAGVVAVAVGAFLLLKKKPLVGFAYVSDIRLIPDSFKGWNIYRWEVDIENISEQEGICIVTFHLRQYSSDFGWQPWQTYEGTHGHTNYEEWYILRSAIIQPGEVTTFSGYSHGRVDSPLTFQRMVTSEAGDILIPPEPLRYLCPICHIEMIPHTPPSFATQEELDEHIATEHPPPPPTLLYGYVTDASTGAPIVGVYGTVYQDHGTETETYRFSTDSQGYYEIVDILYEYDVTQMVIYADGYGTYTNENITIVEGDNELNIQMVPEE